MEAEVEHKQWAFDALQSAAYHAADRAWNGLLSFLTAQSVLVLAWSAILVVREIPTRDIVLLAISFVGVMTSVIWSVLGVRMWDYHLGYVSKLRVISQQQSFLPEWSAVHRIVEREWRSRQAEKSDSSFERARLWLRSHLWVLTANHWVMFLAPVLFSLLHMSMMYVAWCCDTGVESTLLHHQQCSCNPGGYWLFCSLYVVAILLALAKCWKSLWFGLFVVSDTEA